MIAPADVLLAQFETAAQAAQVAEAELRKALALQIAKAERQRTHAFRRARFVRALATSAAGAEEADTAWPRQRQAVCEELGWGPLSKSYEDILARMEPLAGAVRACLVTPEAEEAAAVVRELDAFETWFETTHGKPFYVLFDQYVQEVPVVDF